MSLIDGLMIVGSVWFLWVAFPVILFLTILGVAFSVVSYKDWKEDRELKRKEDRKLKRKKKDYVDTLFR